jgi:methyl-accepting chemotaxis protein
MKFRLSAHGLLERIPVGRQLYTAFGILLLLSGLVGGVAFWSLQQVGQQAHALAGKWLQGVSHLAEARMLIVETRDLEVKHSRTDDASYHAEYEDKMKEAQSKLAAHLKSYEALVASEAERTAFQKVGVALDGYRKAQQQVISLGREKKQVDAADVSDGAAGMATDEVLGALSELSKFNFDGAQAASELAGERMRKADTLLIGLLALSTAFGLVLSITITRHLLSQLGGEPAQAVRVAQAVAQGDLTTPCVTRPGDQRSLMACLAAMQQALAGAVQQVRKGSDQVAATSTQIASGNHDLSGRTESQASALQATSATMEQLDKTVRANAGNAQQARQLAQSASSVAERGGAAVADVVQTMKGINDSSQRIADIIGVIDGIAFQTNILALNAAVEAARAGEQGRGFAVVAGEVRNLAGRSAEAAKEIKALITDSVERVSQGSTQVDQAGRTMQEVVASIRRVSDLISEISLASDEQTRGVAQIGEAIGQMDQGTRQNASLVQQGAAAAESLKTEAQQLVEAVAVFKLTHSH